MRILVAEDDAPLAEFLHQRLVQEQFAVPLCLPAKRLLEQRAEGYEPDCPSVYAQSNGEYGETQEVTGP